MVLPARPRSCFCDPRRSGVEEKLAFLFLGGITEVVLCLLRGAPDSSFYRFAIFVSLKPNTENFLVHHLFRFSGR
jgi:hypothetical protein